MSWIIDGAVKFIGNAYTLIKPQTVIDATNQYRNDNDWLQSFINDCYEQNQTMVSKSRAIYSAYQRWAENDGELPRSNRDFSYELEKRGFRSHRRKDGVYWMGIGLSKQ